jgi:hypothetical protein
VRANTPDVDGAVSDRVGRVDIPYPLAYYPSPGPIPQRRTFDGK